jgi:hypothetical protein
MSPASAVPCGSSPSSRFETWSSLKSDLGGATSYSPALTGNPGAIAITSLRGLAAESVITEFARGLCCFHSIKEIHITVA